MKRRVYDVKTMRRIELLLAKRLPEVDALSLGSLVSGSVHEDADLDFKEKLYGQGDPEKRDLAGDVAAMANTIGGVIVLGIDEVDGAAVKLTPVSLSEAEVLRMRQIVTSNVAPVPRFDIYRVPETSGASTGFYILAVPRSPDAPHAVRVNDALKYPRRDGARTRWLSESEVADAYRSRFQQAASQTERLDQIFREGVSSLETNETAWLAVAISPLSPGEMQIGQRTINEARTKWSGAWSGGTFGRSLFHAAGSEVFAGVGRVVISIGRKAGKSRWGHAELFQDGAGFAASPLWTPGPPAMPNADIIQIDDEQLVNAGVSAVRFLVDHAVAHCGAVGDAVAQAQIVLSGTRECWLTYSRQGPPLQFEGSRAVYSFPVSHHQINIDECQTAAGALIGDRMLLTDLFQFLGVAEVPQISASGELRRRYFRTDYVTSLEKWAEANGVQMTTSLLGEEP